MTTYELLRKENERLAGLLDGADGRQLRQIASAIAHAAVERSGLEHPVIAGALQQLSLATQPDPKLRERVQCVAEQLDEGYCTMSEPFEEREDGGKAEPAVCAAFARARAASAVAAALGDDAHTAAAEAAYEAIFATNDSEYLVQVAGNVFKPCR